MTIPSSVISVRHMPMVMLQRITIMPFIIMAQLIMPLPIMPIRFCIMRVDISSVPMHVIRIPPDVVSMRMVHRGTIMPIPTDGIAIGEPIAIPPITGMHIMPASIIVFVIIVAPRRIRDAGILHGAYPRCPGASSLPQCRGRMRRAVLPNGSDRGEQPLDHGLPHLRLGGEECLTVHVRHVRALEAAELRQEHLGVAREGASRLVAELGVRAGSSSGSGAVVVEEVADAVAVHRVSPEAEMPVMRRWANTKKPTV